MGEDKIPGGYYLKAKKIQKSEIAIAPPHVREIWDWILKEANYEDRTKNGTTVKRGQVLTTYQDIIEGLKWKIGFRTERYTKWQCEKAMKILRKLSMVTTTKTTRGFFITVCNYEHYQNPKNYESHSERHNESHKSPQGSHTIHNELNEGKGKKETKKEVVVDSKSIKEEATSNDDDIPEEVQTAGDVLVEKALSFSNKIPPYTPQSEEYKAATHILEIFTDLTGRNARSRKCIIDKLVDGYDEEMLIKHMKIKIKEDYYKKNPDSLTPENVFQNTHIINANINKKERKKKNIVLKDMIQSDGTRGDE